MEIIIELPLDTSASNSLTKRQLLVYFLFILNIYYLKYYNQSKKPLTFINSIIFIKK